MGTKTLLGRVALTAGVALLAASCAHRGPSYFVGVDSIAGADATAHKTYILLPGNEGVTTDDLQYQEYATYVTRVLNGNGFVPANQTDSADVAVILFYGIGDPQERQYTYTLPVWGQTGIASSSTYGTATAYGDTATYSGTTTYTPSYGVTGYTTHVGTQVTYFRYVLLSGYDLIAYRRDHKQVQLWKTTVTSTGSSGDLRRVFPVLLGAAAQHIGRNTGQQLRVGLHENDPRVRAVKGELEDVPGKTDAPKE